VNAADAWPRIACTDFGDAPAWIIAAAAECRSACTPTRATPARSSAGRQTRRREHRGTTDPALLRAILKVRDGAGGDYWWVECGTCDCAWQVPHYAAASVG